MLVARYASTDDWTSRSDAAGRTTSSAHVPDSQSARADGANEASAAAAAIPDPRSRRRMRDPPKRCPAAHLPGAPTCLGAVLSGIRGGAKRRGEFLSRRTTRESGYAAVRVDLARGTRACGERTVAACLREEPDS